MTKTLALIGHGDTTRAYGTATGGTLDQRIYALATNASQGLAHYLGLDVPPHAVTLGHLRTLNELTRECEYCQGGGFHYTTPSRPTSYATRPCGDCGGTGQNGE